MNIFKKAIGKHVLIILAGVVAILLLSDASILTRQLPGKRVLTVSGTIDPSLSLTLSSNYRATREGKGCSNLSLRGWEPNVTGDRRVARVSDGRFTISVPVDDRSAKRCGYTLQDVSLGIATKGRSPTRWVALFDYSEDMSGTELAVANPLNAYCVSLSGSGDNWFCSRRSDEQAVLGYRTDRMPDAMTLNIHIQTSLPYTLEL